MLLEKNKGQLIKDEMRESGDVDWRMYKLYIVAGGGYFWFICLVIGMIIYYLCNQGATFWLAIWSNDSDKTNPKHSSWYYLWIYSVINFSSLLFLFASLFVALVTRLRASKLLHIKLLDRLLHAPMRFFDTHPIGRIINRFSRDMLSVDNDIPASWASAIRIALYLMSVLLVVCIVTPYFSIGVLPLGIFYWYVQRYFIASSRELRRLSSLMNSPIYSNYGEALEGVRVIRAFNKESTFSDKNKRLVDSDHKAYYPSVASNRWLAIRLEFLGNSFNIYCSGELLFYETVCWLLWLGSIDLYEYNTRSQLVCQTKISIGTGHCGSRESGPVHKSGTRKSI